MLEIKVPKFHLSPSAVEAQGTVQLPALHAGLLQRSAAEMLDPWQPWPASPWILQATSNHQWVHGQWWNQLGRIGRAAYLLVCSCWFTSLALMVVIDLLQIVPLLVRSQHVVQRTHSIWQNLEAPAPTRSMRCGRGSWCHTACGARFRSCFLGPFPLGLLGRFFSKNSWGELGSNWSFFLPGLPKPLPYTVFWVQTPRIPRLSRIEVLGAPSCTLPELCHGRDLQAIHVGPSSLVCGRAWLRKRKKNKSARGSLRKNNDFEPPTLRHYERFCKSPKGKKNKLEFLSVETWHFHHPFPGSTGLVRFCLGWFYFLWAEKEGSKNMAWCVMICHEMTPINLNYRGFLLYALFCYILLISQLNR